MLDILSVTVRDFVFVPERGAIKDTMPDAFKLHRPNCTFITDSTEVKTETPSDPELQHYLYSHYKGTYTLKFLVAAIPNGMIAFVSKLYGGRYSDSHIASNSGFLSLVKPGDVVLSDKGFPHITTSIEGKGAVIVMPPFSSEGQLSEEDMEKTYKIVQVRIHVERVIQRLKVFQILTNRVPISLVSSMPKVACVCAAIVNLQLPVIAKK